MAKKSVMNVNLVKQNLKGLLKDNYCLSKEEMTYLTGYYNTNINKVENLILEGEYVGQSYNNLMTIKGIMVNEPKQLQKVM